MSFCYRRYIFVTHTSIYQANWKEPAAIYQGSERTYVKTSKNKTDPDDK